MPLPIITDVIRVAVRGRATNGHNFANILHFRKTAAITFPAAIAILDPLLLNNYTVNNGAGLAWRSIGPTSATLTQFEYTPLDGVSATTVITHALAGLDAGDPLPCSNSIVATFRTATRGRSFRGRAYTGPYAEDANAVAVPTAATVTAIQTQWSRFVTVSLVGTGVSLVVASYQRVLATDCIAVSVDGRWDTQRRRLNS